MNSDKKPVRKAVSETAPKAAPSNGSKPKRVAKPPTTKIPALLLEGDAPSPPQIGGPGRRYALGPSAPAEKFPETTGELPEAYGTERLFLTARDPQWLYATWDLTAEQQRKYNAASADKHLVVRVYVNEPKGEPVAQVHVHPESKNWFIHVGRPGTKFVAELGYYEKGGKWKTISVSGATLTPPESLSDDTSVRFATIPVDLPFDQLLALIKTALRDNVPLVEAMQQLRAAGFKNLPDAKTITGGRWTPAQEQALGEIVRMDAVRRVWMGSVEITELIRRQMLREMASLAASQFSLPSSLGVSSLSSPFGGVPGRKGFWFNVNAELIIYGATEPDATVTIGGRVIKLRSDGTFSYRFSLPDGQYALPAVATSADGDDCRSADLRFSRKTIYGGDVGTHPQDPALKPPKVEHVA
jgi:hypothetical protein